MDQNIPPRGEGDGEAAGVEEPNLNYPPMDKEKIIESMMEMGFIREHAKLAVEATGGSSVKAAVFWILDNPQQFEASDNVKDYKMVFVVNTSLNMSIGEAELQAAHAAAVLLLIILISSPDHLMPALQWMGNGIKNFGLHGDDTDHLLRLAEEARSLELLPFLKHVDAGQTEIPSGSLSVLAIFGESSLVDRVTGTLNVINSN